jgi:quercetin dioxygenase-like cupin family protein
MRRLLVSIALAALCAAPFALAAAGADPTAVRTVVADAPAAGTGGYRLATTRVSIAAGVALAKHHHPGTQIGTMLAGRLTYTVFVGAVEVVRGGKVVHTIAAGETYVLRAGDTVIEQPTDTHEAGNRGTVAVRMVISSLFPQGAPAAITVR